MLKGKVDAAEFGSHGQRLTQKSKRVAAEVVHPIGVASVHMDVRRASRAVIVPRWGRKAVVITSQEVGWKECTVIQEGHRANMENAGSQRRRLIRAVVRGRTGCPHGSISRRYPSC